jgi:hypothetical protein
MTGTASTAAANNLTLPAPLNQNHPKSQPDWQQILNQLNSWQQGLITLILPFQQTTAEQSAGVIPANYAIASHVATGEIYPERYGTITTGVDCSQILHYAQLVQQQVGAPIVLQGTNYTAALNFNYGNARIRGQGSALTTLTLPLTSLAISTLSVTSNILTVMTSAPHGVWVGKSIRITGNSYAACNTGFRVVAVNSSTQFACTNLNDTISNGSGTGGLLLPASNGLEFNNGMDGNSAIPMTGFVIEGMTLQGQRTNGRSVPDGDLTDQGIFVTAYSDYEIRDVRVVNYWNAGCNIDINSNFGFIEVYVENCGQSTSAVNTPVGFDINSSKFIVINAICASCPYTGARILDNCQNITGRYVINNAGQDGFVVNNQSNGINSSYAINLDVSINNGCSVVGFIAGTRVHHCHFRIQMQGVQGVGVQDAYGAVNPNWANIWDVTTSSTQTNSCQIGGVDSAWRITSSDDGALGPIGAYYAVNVDGQRNTITANIEDTRGGQLATTSGLTGGTGYTNGIYTNVPLTSGHGQQGAATITVAGSAVTAVAITTAGFGYQVGDVLSASNLNLGGAGSGFLVTVATVAGAPLVRGVNFSQNSADNYLAGLTYVGLVTNWQDQGLSVTAPNRFAPKQYRGSAALAYGTVAVGVTQIGTITVNGASNNTGDQVELCTGINNSGVALFGEVTGANTVTVWALNETGGGVGMGTRMTFATVTKAVPG